MAKQRGLRALTIEDPDPPIAGNDLMAFESRHQIRLPDSYKAFLAEHNGGEPFPNVFPIQGFANNPYGTVHIFFGLHSRFEVYDLDHVLRDHHGKIPSGIVPIACTQGPDYICLDLRKESGPVMYWDRMPFWGENVWNESDLYKISDNFEGFIESLREREV